MSRTRLIAVAVFFAAAAIALTTAATLYASRVLAVRDEQDRLTARAESAVTRADMALHDTEDALRGIAAFDAAPCSPDHIARMRQITINNRTIREIGYFDNGVLKCTSWGVTEEIVKQAPAEVIMPDGLEMTLSLEPKVSRGKPMMALQQGHYNALVDPERFVDVADDLNVQLTVATSSGAIIGTQNDPGPEIIHAIGTIPQHGIANDQIYASVRRSGWTVVADERRSLLAKELRREQLLLLPLGAFFAFFLVGVVVWVSRRRLSPRGELAIAVKKREFSVVYQPTVELGTGRCIGAEALVRWKRPDGLIVKPDQFIPLAEQSGLIKQITDQVVESVVSDLAGLLVSDRSMHISVNISTQDFETGRALDVIDRAAAAAKIEPPQIWLEITERGVLKKDSARAMIVKARQSGHLVAIDDFGTGYSSLSYLQELPLDVLKIDKTFVDTIGTDSATSNVCPHIIDMAKTLKLMIIAEGVETQLQADYLRERDVEYAQGFLYSQPLNATEFMAYCDRNRSEQAG